MKISIRTKFTVGMAFFFVIIAGISILSAYHLSNLSKKTDAILKENHFSVIYARDMAEYLTNINQEITRSYVSGSITDSNLIDNSFASFEKSLRLEKNNITEAGEDKLASGIESGFDEYQRKIKAIAKVAILSDKIIPLQTQFNFLYQQSMLLSQMNEQAIILKADDAKASAQKGLRQVTIFGTICFIIAISLTFNFANYFNGRFSKLYNGIKEIGSNNFGQRLYFEGEDEFYDISLIFNNMAENLEKNKLNEGKNTIQNFEEDFSSNQIQELKRILEQMHGIEERAVDLIAKLEHK